MKPGSAVSVSDLSALFGSSAAECRGDGGGGGRRSPPPKPKFAQGARSGPETPSPPTRVSVPIPCPTTQEVPPLNPQPPSPPPPPSPPRSYLRRGGGGWRPLVAADFGDGGAFPEIHVVQLPEGLGWGASCGIVPRASSSSSPDGRVPAPPASLAYSFDDLQTRAARVMLRLDGGDDAGKTKHRAGLASPPSGHTQQRMTAEYASFVRFILDQSDGGSDPRQPIRKIESDAVVAALLAAHPNARPIERVFKLDPETVALAYLQSGHAGVDGKAVGTPVVVADGAKGWERGIAWGLDGLAQHYRECTVRCNDRAPARHADAGDRARELGRERAGELERGRGRGHGQAWEQGREQETSIVDRPRWGGAQQSCALPLRDFIEYVASRPGCDDPVGLEAADAPFYCNGWRAFNPDVTGGGGGGGSCGGGRGGASVDGDGDGDSGGSGGTMASAFPPPYFTASVDHTRDITRQTHLALLPTAPPAAAQSVVQSLDTTLSKIFAGPAGTVTRLHYDAGEAHAWLGQAQGRKLFVCYPPDDAPNLYLIEGETETVQSAVDPLAGRERAVLNLD